MTNCRSYPDFFEHSAQTKYAGIIAKLRQNESFSYYFFHINQVIVFFWHGHLKISLHKS